MVAGTAAGEVFDPLDLPAFTDLLLRWCGIAGSIPRGLPQQVVQGMTFAMTVTAIRQLVSELLTNKAA
jgi:hypothetical protein